MEVVRGHNFAYNGGSMNQQKNKHPLMFKNDLHKPINHPNEESEKWKSGMPHVPWHMVYYLKILLQNDSKYQHSYPE